MDKRGEISDYFQWTVVYVLIFAVFFISAFFIISGNLKNAAFWEEFYAKEIARVIDLSESRDVISLDITQATKIAQKNGKDVSKAEELFSFDEIQGTVVVSLRQGTGTSYSYFMNRSLDSYRIELISGEIDKNRLVMVVK